VHSEPHYLFLSYLLAWLGLQLTVLFLQDTLGPRFFVPSQVEGNSSSFLIKHSFCQQDITTKDVIEELKSLNASFACLL
jgi:hypothetical protein